ncbi:MAG: NADH-quinone oxidoreductase subunit N [Alphaproteobacteria bacterium]
MNLNFLTFLPEAVLFFMALYLLFFHLYRSQELSNEKTAFLSFFFPKIGYYGFVLLEAAILLNLWVMKPYYFESLENIFFFDRLSIGSKLLIFIIGISWLGIGGKSILRAFQRENMRSFEYPVLLLFSMIGSFLLVSSGHLVGIFMAILLQMLPVIGAVSLYEDNTKASAAMMRFFILEAICLGLFIFGVSLVYAFAEDLTFKGIATALQSTSGHPVPFYFAIIGFSMILITFLFRLGVFPFHLWMKDFYKSASNLIVPFLFTLYFSLFVSLGRLLFQAFPGLSFLWKPLLFAAGIGSCAWGALGALFQSNIRSFFGFNYMFHLGMVFLGLSGGEESGFQASVFYWTVYSLSANAFFFFWAHLSENDRMLDHVDQATGLGIKHPAFTLLIALSLLSLASIPPFAGFWCKLYILKSLIGDNGGYVLGLLVLTIIASFQYFHVIRAIYFSEADKEIRVSYEWKTIWTFVPLFLVGFFLMQDRIFNMIPKILKVF